MGTNYYIVAANALRDPTSLPVGPGPALHIGKSSGGWCFALHVYPNEPEKPQSLDDWRMAFETGTIVDEYGSVETPADMLGLIVDRPAKLCTWSRREYEQNQGEPGPNGLVRHKPLPGHCIGHGDGTYDLIVGDFS